MGSSNPQILLRKTTSVDMNPNWEQVLDQFEQVMASGIDEALQVDAMKKLAYLCNCVPEEILNRTIPILAKVLDDNDSSNGLSWSVRQAAACCLRRISCHGDGRLATEIGQSGAIHSLLRLLPESDHDFQRVLVGCLWCAVTFGSENRVIVATNGGLEIVVAMLNSCDEDTGKYLLEILSALTLMREGRRVLSSLGGLRFLVEAARFGSMVSRERACQAIGLLGVRKRARHRLVELGIILVLVELFRVGDSTTKLVAGNSLGVISAHVDYIRLVSEAGAILLYAELLQGPDFIAVAEENAISIAEHLIRILREGDDESKAVAADVFCGLSDYKHSIPVVRSSGAIPILVNLLRDGNVEVRERVSGAIAKLSYDKEDRVALADAGAVPLMIDILHDESEELRDTATEALINFYEDPSLQERISATIDDLSLQRMEMIRLHASNEQMVRSLRRMFIEQLTWDPDLV
ncbi:hypothetical protein EZV62_008688 [Acer yangbiense]|uniref:Armadillo repeat-containing domain-containing protein n=1 Tax=Acer yangbiense TaxID=1000413 RepID=A0A5C7IDN1_9ROSI|nr:hypothetical protein EZV62_008688 [Acer yangbiense]